MISSRYTSIKCHSKNIWIYRNIECIKGNKYCKINCDTLGPVVLSTYLSCCKGCKEAPNELKISSVSARVFLFSLTDKQNLGCCHCKVLVSDAQGFCSDHWMKQSSRLSVQTPWICWKLEIRNIKSTVCRWAIRVGCDLVFLFCFNCYDSWRFKQRTPMHCHGWVSGVEQ